MIKKIRHYLGAGLLVSLPIFITAYLIVAIFRFIDGIFGKGINILLKKYLGFAIPGIGIIVGIIIVVFIGFLAANFFGRRLFKALESWFLRLPFVRLIYPTAKQIVDSFVMREGPAFKKVVLVEYPSKGLWTVGFLTNESFKDAREKTGKDLVHVLIAGTPSPVTGFLVLVPREDIKILDISVEEGIKLVVSGGIVKPGL